MDFTSLIKKGQPSIEPHELTLVDDPTDILYDKRIELPMEDGSILNFAAVGQAQPVSVRPRGFDELVPVDGVQRTKRALVINHLVGRHAYTGKLKPVSEAIKRLTGSDIGKRILEECPTGMKIQVALYRGDDKQALRAKGSANIWRVDDLRAEVIRKAQQMARHGIEHDKIREDLGIKSLATLERYLTADPDRPAKSNGRGKAKRPSAKRLAVVAELANKAAEDPEFPIAVAHALAWADGKRSDDDFFREYPALRTSKKRKAA